MFIVAGIVVNQKYGVSHMSNGALRGSLGLGPNCAVNITSCPGRPGCGAGAQCVSTLIGCQCQNLCREVGQSCCTAGSTFCCPGLFWDGATNTCQMAGSCAAPASCTTGIGAGPNQCPAGSTFGPANGCGIAGVHQGTNGCCTTPPPPPPPPPIACPPSDICWTTLLNCPTGAPPTLPSCSTIAPLAGKCCPRPQCSDTIENDTDGFIDLADPGCTDAADNDETNVIAPPPAPNCVDTSLPPASRNSCILTSFCPYPQTCVPSSDCNTTGGYCCCTPAITPPPPPNCTGAANINTDVNIIRHTGWTKNYPVLTAEVTNSDAALQTQAQQVCQSFMPPCSPATCPQTNPTYTLSNIVTGYIPSSGIMTFNTITEAIGAQPVDAALNPLKWGRYIGAKCTRTATCSSP